MKKIKNFFKSIDWKFILFITFFLLICLEIFGRVYLVHILKKSVKPKFQFDSYRVYSHIPNFVEGDDSGNWIEINGQGFRRSADVSLNKETGVYRVFLLGASAAHGITTAPPYPVVHIYMDETIDYHLEKWLNEKYPGKKIEVINAAVTGYHVFQHTSYLLSELLNYDPDMVVFVDGTNDHFINNPDYNYMYDNPYLFWEKRLKNPSIITVFDYVSLWATNYSGFARGFYSWRLNQDAYNPRVYANQSFPDTTQLIHAHKEKSKQGFLRFVETNIQLLKANDIEVIVCLQPMLVLRDTRLLSQQEKDFLHEDKNINTLYPHVVNYLSELTGKYNVPFIDLNIEFNKADYMNEQLLLDYCHFSARGGEVVASAIFPVADSIISQKNISNVSSPQITNNTLYVD